MADQSEQEDKLEPLVIFYDSEASDGNVYYGDVIEIAATCHPGVVVGSFERLINTKQRLGLFAIHESGITEDLLQDKPFIDKVIVEFLDWIDEMVVLAQKKNNTSYFPVLCAHGGYQFDFLILFANLERKGIPPSKFSDSNIHFADSFLFCQQLQQDDNRLLQNTRLSIDGLFHNFFPRHTIKGRHRAMGDVKAMVKIFTQTPLKNVLHRMSVSTIQERVKYFVSQSSAKEQLLILEEKMSSLDACSRNMYSKRLLKEGLTYDLLKTVFLKCSSYMDFWQTLKKIGIERKVAKHFTSQFSAMGLENQGSLGFALNAAIQNGSLSNGSSQDSNGHSDRGVNGNLGSSNGDSITSGPSKSTTQNSNSKKETKSSRGKLVLETIPAERATSSSRAFEERPLDYAVTSSADERIKAYAMPRSAKQPVNKDASENAKIASSELEKRSCHGVEQSIADSVSSENGNSRDPSVCNGNENWDSEIEHSVKRGHFVLQFDEVIPSSIMQDDVCSSSATQHTDVTESYSKRAPANPDANQGRRIPGNKKELASHSKRNGDGKRHERSKAKKGGESAIGFNKGSKIADKQDTTVNSVHNNKTMKEVTRILDKSKVDAASSENSKQGNIVSSGEKGPKQVNLKGSAGSISKITDTTDGSKTSKFSTEEVGGANELDPKSHVQAKRRKASSKKKQSSVTFVTPVDVASVDASSDLSKGDVQMTTVYVGDVPILVPVEKHPVSCEDDLDQPTQENKELQTGNISTDETTMSSRKEGGGLNEEGPRTSSTVAEGVSLSKENEDGHSVSLKVEDGQNHKTDEENKTIVPDTVQPTSTIESLSSSTYETSDTGSNLDYNKNEKRSAPSVNHCPSGDISDAHDASDQVSSAVEQVNQPTGPTIEEHPSYDLENAGNVKPDSENACVGSETQAVNEHGGHGLVDDSSEVDINPDMVAQEQMNGYPEESWPSSDAVCPNPTMYQMPPPQYPFQMPYPTAMPSAYGFYPHLPHMMPMIPGPRPVPYPMPFASQGMMPFGGFPPRFSMPMPMFQPSVYPPVQEGPPPNLHVSEQEPMPQTSRSSPEVLGIPDNRIQTEHQNNKISSVSFSTSSDDQSARSSPFPVDDSSGKTTPLTTPHRSPVDEHSPGALSSSDRGDQGYQKHKGYRKDSRPSRYYSDERSRRPYRNGPWKGTNYRDKNSKKYLPEKVSRADLGDYPESRSKGSDVAQEEGRKTNTSDYPSKEDAHSSRYARESSDQDKKSDSSSPTKSSKPPQPEQLTPPRSELKTDHGTSKLSPKTTKTARSDHASRDAPPTTKSRADQVTPPRKEEKDHSPKTSHRDTRNEQQPREARNVAADPTATLQTSTSSKSNQGSSFKSSQNESHKSGKSDGVNKRVSKDVGESQKSSRTSMHMQAHPKAHPRSDADHRGNTAKPSPDSSVPTPSTSDKKSDQNQKDDSKEAPSGSLKKEAKQQSNETRVKWPQSALASQKFKEPPKPQRDLSSRNRRARESYSSGSEREKRAESNRHDVVSRRNEDVKEYSKAADSSTGVKKTKGSTTASEKATPKDPFSASANDLKTKSDDTTQKNARENQKSVNYRDVLLGKQSTNTNENDKPSLRTNGILSSDRIKDERSGSMEPKTHSQAANTAPNNPPLPEGGIKKNYRGKPHPGEQEKTVGKEYRNEKKQPYKEMRGGSNTTHGSVVSRETTPRNNTRNASRNRNYDSNNNNNFQSRNTVSKVNKS